MTDTASMLASLRDIAAPFEQRQAMSALVTDMTFREFLQATFNPYLQTGRRCFPDEPIDPDIADRILDEEWAYFRDDYQSVVEGNRPFESLAETYGKSPAWPVYCFVISKDVPGLAASTARAVWGDIATLVRPEYATLEEDALPTFPCYVASAMQGAQIEWLIMVRNCKAVAAVSWGGTPMNVGSVLEPIMERACELPYSKWFEDDTKLSQFAVIMVRLQPPPLAGDARTVEVIDVVPGACLENGNPTPSYRSRHAILQRLVDVGGPAGTVSFVPVTCHLAGARDEFAEIRRMARREFAVEIVAHQPDAAYGSSGTVIVESL